VYSISSQLSGVLTMSQGAFHQACRRATAISAVIGQARGKFKVEKGTEGSAVREAGLTDLVLYYPLIVMRCAGSSRKTARGEDEMPRHKS
jgi:hypothetical protein